MSGAEERLANDPTSELWGEHRSRYRFAAQFASGQRVLDVASGAGFGLRMLREAGASSVIGLDYDPSAIVEARRMEPAARLVRGDATSLPLATASLDLVVSFETIEHVPDAAALVAEIRRVLRPGGRLVLSTPNRTFGPPERHTGNPFHVREFTLPELRELLWVSFRELRILGQRPSERYRYVPYLLVERRASPEALVWKALNRLPFRLKDGLSRTMSGRPFYPGEREYVFAEADAAGAHALLAVAR